MFWRKALVATLVIILLQGTLSVVLSTVVDAVVTSTQNGNSTWLQDMNLTFGSFIYFVNVFQWIVEIVSIFLIIWWTLRTSIPMSPAKRKRDNDLDPLRTRLIVEDRVDELSNDDHTLQTNPPKKRGMTLS
jgi:hypothetical protein